jgi:hypothetical protein
MVPLFESVFVTEVLKAGLQCHYFGMLGCRIYKRGFTGIMVERAHIP